MSDRKRPRHHPRNHARNSDFAVQQNFVSETDINVKMARHMRGPNAHMPLGNPGPNARQGRFMDMPSETFHEMLNRVTDARHQFMNLPAKVRTRFQNDPYQLLRFLENPANRPEAERLGLVDPKYVPPGEMPGNGSLDPENRDADDDSQKGQKADEEANPRHQKKGAK